jgi:peptidoglycan LD-endopeptidase CwlK
MARVSLDTLIERSVKNMGTGIHPVVKESAIEVIRRAYAEGINVQISSGYRSAAEQNALYQKGRRGIAGEKVVTNAKAGQSNHNYGLAVDYFLTTEDGKGSIWTVNKQWRRVAEIGKSLGFSWGGEWTSFPDYPHLEMMGGLTISQLQAGKRPNLVSEVTKTETVKKEVKPLPKTPEQIAYEKELIDAIDHLKWKGIMNGERMNDNVTRSQMALIEYRTLQLVYKHIEELEKKIQELEKRLGE